MGKRLPDIALVRAYDIGPHERGYRVLVDRLWPRGRKKDDLRLDEWAKELAPSTELRKWFNHRLDRWTEFKQRYRRELRSRPEAIDKLLRTANRRRVLLVYGARDTEHNHAIVLRDFLKAKRTASAIPN